MLKVFVQLIMKLFTQKVIYTIHFHIKNSFTTYLSKIYSRKQSFLIKFVILLVLKKFGRIIFSNLKHSIFLFNRKTYIQSGRLIVHTSLNVFRKEGVKTIRKYSKKCVVLLMQVTLYYITSKKAQFFI